MLRKLLNHLKISYKIKLDGPLLIKSEQTTVTGVDMPFLLTYRAGQAHPVIPGSSIKGALRAHAERLCRTLAPGSVCEPYRVVKDHSAARPASCGLRLGEKKTLRSWEAYKHSCPICRLFGSTQFIGRFSTSDANTDKRESALQCRDGVAIDRFTGGAYSGAKFDLEVLPEGEFTSQLQLQNFELWQLALCALVLRDFSDGIIRLGSGKSRGLGQVHCEVESMILTSYGAKAPKVLNGLGHLADEAEKKQYGYWREKAQIKLPEAESYGLRHCFDLSQGWARRLSPALSDFTDQIKNHKTRYDAQFCLES